MRLMVRLLLFSLLVFFCLGSSCKIYGQSVTYFAKYDKLADSLSRIYKIPSCIILSVGFLESGGGTSTLAKKLHNHFGIVGDCNYRVSRYKSSYKYYPSIRESFIGFCELVKSKKFYASMAGSKDQKLWAKKIAATGYAANPTKWSNAVYSISKKYCN